MAYVPCSRRGSNDAASDEIVVCGDRDVVSPYRLPLPLAPEVGARDTVSVAAERNGLFDYDAGGNGSCSTAGAAGGSGCGWQQHKRYFEQRANAPDPRGWAFSPVAK